MVATDVHNLLKFPDIFLVKKIIISDQNKCKMSDIIVASQGRSQDLSKGGYTVSK